MTELRSLDEIFAEILDDQYDRLLIELQEKHTELQKGTRENPALIGEDLMYLRYRANRLWTFINQLRDLLNEELLAAAKKQQTIYVANHKLTGSENKAMIHSSALCREDNARVKAIENKLKTVEGNYERYSSIAMSLQSRMKEFASERVLG